MVLNTDGSMIQQTNFVVVGGLLWDELGRCMVAFTTNLGKCSITRAELRRAITGLDMAWQAEFRRVVVHVDSKVVLALLASYEEPTHQHAGEIITLRHLIDRDQEVTFSHMYREGNKAADYLVGIRHGLPLGIHSFSTSDCNLCYFLRLYYMGISEPRIITAL
ncbi:Putative ribonuclease H protein At1g65750 [Linum perenne]